jgi:hypothetical protein
VAVVLRNFPTDGAVEAKGTGVLSRRPRQGRGTALASDKRRYLIVNASGADAGFGAAIEIGVPAHTEPAA